MRAWHPNALDIIELVAREDMVCSVCHCLIEVGEQYVQVAGEAVCSATCGHAVMQGW